MDRTGGRRGSSEVRALDFLSHRAGEPVATVCFGPPAVVAGLSMYGTASFPVQLLSMPADVVRVRETCFSSPAPSGTRMEPRARVGVVGSDPKPNEPR